MAPTPPTPEEVRDTVLKAQSVMQDIMEGLATKPPENGALFVALQMLLASVSIQMGVSFEEMMGTLAQNMPTFYKKWHEAEAKRVEQERRGPAPVFDFSEFRKKE
jgi:hypothetical protein